MADTDCRKPNGRLILGWGDIFILSLLITFCGALGFSVAAFLQNRPINISPLIGPLADQFEQLLADNFIPRQNIRMVREDAVIPGKERYRLRIYEIQLPDNINWPGLRRLLVEALARKQVTVVESSSEPGSGQYRMTLYLGRSPFVEAVFNTGSHLTVSGPDCDELMDVARQAMLAVGVISSAMEPENSSSGAETSFSVHLPPGLDPLKLENALADAISPFDGFLEVLEEKPTERMVRMNHKSGPCAALRLVSEPASSPPSANAAAPPSGNSPHNLDEPASAAENLVEPPIPDPSSSETLTDERFQTRWEPSGHAMLNLISPSILLGSLSGNPSDPPPPDSPEMLSDHPLLPAARVRAVNLQKTAIELVSPMPNSKTIPEENNALVASPLATMRPRVAIILDDGGWGGPVTEEILSMDSRLTLSILPNTPYGTETALRAQERGFEIMLHMPMQNGRSHFPGELRTDMDADTIRELTLQAVSQIPGATGANNHTGTTFTRNRPGMEAFMDVMVALGWFFVDSRTVANSVAYTVAVEKGVPALNREIFLDHENTFIYINRQFRALIALARKNGRALAIGHFRPMTVQALRVWIPELEKEKIDLVHVSDLLP